MIRTFAFGLAFAGLAGIAHAQDIGGSYTVEGTNHDGSTYGGTAEITLASDTTCEIDWVTGPTESHGICSRNGNAFAAAYVLNDAVGLVIYMVKPDGSMEGLWTIQGQPGTGTENLIPAN
jgi:hypothetical protein